MWISVLKLTNCFCNHWISFNHAGKEFQKYIVQYWYNSIQTFTYFIFYYIRMYFIAIFSIYSRPLFSIITPFPRLRIAVLLYSHTGLCPALYFLFLKEKKIIMKKHLMTVNEIIKNRWKRLSKTWRKSYKNVLFILYLIP